MNRRMQALFLCLFVFFVANPDALTTDFTRAAVTNSNGHEKQENAQK